MSATDQQQQTNPQSLEMDFSEFVDFYAVLECPVDADEGAIKKSYRKLVLDWHPDKRPDSPTHAGKKMFQMINDAYDTLKDEKKREEYTAIWREYHKQKLAPFERAELSRKEGNEFYKKGQIAARDNNIPQALSMYQQAIDKYSEGIEIGTSDHRLHSNRALCYAVLRDWPKAKKDAHIVVGIRPNFMKGWFTLVRCYIMENDLERAAKELETGLKNCDSHPDLQKLEEEIAQKKKQQENVMAGRGGSPPLLTGANPNGGSSPSTANQTMPAPGSARHPYYLPSRDVTPSRTPPTPIRQGYYYPIGKPTNAGGPPGFGWGVELEQTGNFGKGTDQRIYDLNDTASFGRTIGYANPNRNRSTSPRTPPPPPGMPSNERNFTPKRSSNTPPRNVSPFGGGAYVPSSSGRNMNATIGFGQENPLNQSYNHNMMGQSQQFVGHPLAGQPSAMQKEQMNQSGMYGQTTGLYTANAAARKQSSKEMVNRNNSDDFNKTMDGQPRRAPSLAKQALSRTARSKSPRT